MKQRLLSKIIVLIVTLGLLITGTIAPVLATSASEVDIKLNDLNSNINFPNNEDLRMGGEKFLQAEDPSIAKESMILRYVDSLQFNEARHIQRLPDLEDLNTYVFANADGTRSIYMMHGLQVIVLLQLSVQQEL